MKRIKYLLLFLTALILITACSESWYDVNKDPNNPEDVTPELVFPSALMSTSTKIALELNIAGGMWSQYWTQNPTSNQYKEFDAYDVKSTILDEVWDEWFSGALNELEIVRKKTEASGDERLYMMATILRVYVYQYIVDLWDQAPYSDALKGAEGLTDPSYQSGQEIYDALIVELDAVLGKDYSKYTKEVPGDFVFSGDPDSWVAFGNLLKMKIYLRQWNVRPDVAQAGIQKLIDDNAPILSEDAAITIYEDVKGKGNPLYESDQRELNTTLNIRASHTFVSWLEANADDRIGFYFKPGSTGAYIGNAQGDFNINVTADQANQISLANIEAEAPTYLFSEAECYFIQAEAQFRLGNTAAIKPLYDAGVTAAFGRFGLEDSTSKYISTGGAYELKTGDSALYSIITQKWAALAGINGMEAYLEQLRTGYPSRTNLSADDPAYIPGEFTHPVSAVLPQGQFPRRLVFADSERKNNKNVPTEVSTTIAVWWNNK